ncbi:MAG: YifB family Mg chelatase-like AAA ATPase [Filifactoraceae bacterium]
MFYKTLSCAVEGIEGYIVTVESDVAKGMNSFATVGLPDVTVKESKDRIKSAIINSDLKFPNKKIVINLSPSDVKKEGSHFDLPIALSILNSEYNFLAERYENTAFFGELSLNGKIKKVSGMIPFMIACYESDDIRRVMVPVDNYEEARVIQNIEIIPVENIKDVVYYLVGRSDKVLKVSEEPCKKILSNDYDFKDVKGNLMAVRAAEISASGFHNFFMIGPPGSGKSMIAKRMSSIMEPLNDQEYIEVSRIYSTVGKFNDDILARKRPFRSPHHTATSKSIIGGGQNSTPGEVVYSHKGILFLDELLEFDKKVLEAMRQPIEDKYVNISRVRNSYKYPCDFLLVAATNPCPCGHYLNPFRECVCQEFKINNYLSRASAPFLDRFDVFVEMVPIEFSQLNEINICESSEVIRGRVKMAIETQAMRFSKKSYKYNSLIPPSEISMFCVLTKDAQELVEIAYTKYNYSIRGYHKLLKIARTIADLDGKDIIDISHISEAISYRKPLQKYWR